MVLERGSLVCHSLYTSPNKYVLTRALFLYLYLASSTGLLLKMTGLKVTAIKIDPYMNVDAGTMRPTEHGESILRTPPILVLARVQGNGQDCFS